MNVHSFKWFTIFIEELHAWWDIGASIQKIICWSSTLVISKVGQAWVWGSKLSISHLKSHLRMLVDLLHGSELSLSLISLTRSFILIVCQLWPVLWLDPSLQWPICKLIIALSLTVNAINGGPTHHGIVLVVILWTLHLIPILLNKLNVFVAVVSAMWQFHASEIPIIIIYLLS